MELSYKVKINGTRDQIWKYYAKVENWKLWDNGLEEISIEGDFTNETNGIMKMKELPPLSFQLSKVLEKEKFSNFSITPMGTIYFEHDIFEENGELYIRCSVSLQTEQENLKSLGILNNIFSNVPDAMMKLKELVENE